VAHVRSLTLRCLCIRLCKKKRSKSVRRRWIRLYYNAYKRYGQTQALG